MANISKQQRINKRMNLSDKELKNRLASSIKRGFTDRAEEYAQILLKKKGVDLRTKKAKEEIKKIRDKAHKKEVEKLQRRNLVKKAEKIIKKTGVKFNITNSKFKYGLPNTEIAKLTKEEYISLRLQMNMLEDEPMMEEVIKMKARRDYNKVVKKLKEINIQKINNIATKEMNKDIDKYFANIGALDRNLLRDVKKLASELSIQKKYELLDVLFDERFRKEYGSDGNEAGQFMDAEERQGLRLERLMDILKNETGKQIDKDGNIISYDKSSKSKGFSAYS